MLLPGIIQNLRTLSVPIHWIVILIGIQLGAVVFEGIGIGMLLPILEYLSNASTQGAPPPSGKIWDLLTNFLAIAGLKPTLVPLLSMCFFAILVRQGFFFAREMFVGYVAFELARRIRDTAFDRFIRTDLAYHDKLRGGDFVNELTIELEATLRAVRSAINFVSFGILLAGYSIVAVGLTPSLSFGAIGVFAVSGIGLSFLFRRMRDVSIRATDSNQRLLSFLVERLKHVRLIRLAGVEDAETALLRDFTTKQRDIALERRRIFALMATAIEPVILLAAFVLLYISSDVMELKLERILLFFFILVRMVPVVKDLISTRQSYIANIGSVEVVVRRLNELEAAKDVSTGTQKINKIADGIAFEDVHFAYGHSVDDRNDGQTANGETAGGKTAEGQKDGDQATGAKALHGATLTFPAGKMTAIVGPSGAGKSTLIDLLPRLRRPDTGTIKIDGTPLEFFDTDSLRQAISFAPQQPQMFDVTVAEHIRYGFRKATREQVEQAAKLANAYDFIMALPNGFETKLGENGSRLSGGQRQRLDLARALVRQAPLLVMDEPTASLDAESEGLFRAALRKIRDHTDITIVLIGHNLMTTASADQIVVLREGRVDASGPHTELMDKCAWYTSAFNGQLSDVPTTAPQESAEPVAGA